MADRSAVTRRPDARLRMKIDGELSRNEIGTASFFIVLGLD